MYILICLALISFVAMYFMLWRKLALVRNGAVVEGAHAHPFVPDLENLKKLAHKNTRWLAYKTLVTALRLHIRGSNTLKNKYGELKQKIREIRDKNGNGLPQAKPEVSNFLQLITDYKNKIRHIKHKIKKEEENS